jgi:hypothetical protein
MAADQAPSHVLVMQFVAALLQRTLGCPTVEAHQQALQGFLDDLTPWINPVELPTLLEQPFTLFDHLAFTPNEDGNDEDMTVALSPRRGNRLPRLAAPAGAGPAGVQLVRSGPCLGYPRRPPARACPPSPRRTPRLRQAQVSARGTRTRYRRSGSSSSPCPPPSWPGSICRRPCTRPWWRRSGCAHTERAHDNWVVDL